MPNDGKVGFRFGYHDSCSTYTLLSAYQSQRRNQVVLLPNEAQNDACLDLN